MTKCNQLSLKDPLNLSNKVLNRSLDEYEVISFDIFDTAVLRKTAEPKDVFLLMERKLIDEFGQDLAYGFANKRVTTEVELVEKVWSNNRSNEVTLDDIYNALSLNYPEFHKYKDSLKTIELEIERNITICNPLIFSVYEKAIKANKKVIFASDIYLPKYHIEEILNDAGYKHYHKLYVSCEIAANKASGSMYPYILDRTAASPEKIIHFGDSEWSDVKVARKYGLHAQKVPYSLALLKRSRYFPKRNHHDISASLFQGIQKKYCLLNDLDSASDVGYQVLGPIVFGFLNWTIEHAIQNKINNLYFIAREGWFLKKAFDVITAKRRLSIKSHYLLASRRSLLFPFIEGDIAESVLSFAISLKPVKLKTYFDSIEVFPNNAQLKAAGFSDLNQIIDVWNDKSEHKMLSSLLNSLTPEILKRAEEEKQLYKRYMDSIGMNSLAHVGIVDSGWYGSGHSRIASFLDAANPSSLLSGFYFALHKSGEKRFTEKSRGHGYFYQFDSLNNDIEAFVELAKIIEVLLSAPSESFKRFRDSNGELTPVYIKEAQSLELDPTLKELQEGALKFINDYLEVDLQGNYVPSRNYMRMLFADFIKNPSANEARQIGSLPYEADMMRDNASATMFAKSKITLYNLATKPHSVIKEFNTTSWRSGYFMNIESPMIRFFLKTTSRHYFKHRFLFKVLKKVKRKVSNLWLRLAKR